MAEYDGRLAGGVHLRLTTISPLNLDLSVQVMSPQVFPEFRRHGIGRALMDAAVAWAEERGVGHLASAAPSGSRDANRFMARLALGPMATLRLAPTTVVRAKLIAQRPPVARARAAAHPRPRRTALDAPPGGGQRLGPAQSSANAATNRAQRDGSSVSPASRHHSQ